MKLLYPEFLFALSVLAIPILVHLFNFRKFKQVYFPSLRFLQQIQQKTKKQSKLKHLLVLLSRILAFIFLVFAFARPYIPADKNTKQTGHAHLSVYLDNSLSMDSKGPNGYIFEEAKEKALEMASFFSAADKFHLITNDLEGRHQRWVSREEFIQLVEDVQISGNSRPFNEIYLRQKDMINKTENSNIRGFAFSDFQKTQFDFNSLETDSTLTYTLVPFENPVKRNIYIDSIWFYDPVRKSGQEELISISIKHNYEKTIEVKCDLEINGKPVGFGNYRLEPTEKNVTFELSFTTYEKGNIFAKLTLTEYPDPDMLFDDSYFFAYRINEKINVASVYESSPDSLHRYSRKIFDNKSEFNFYQSDLQKLDYSLLKNQQCVIINDLNDISGGLSAELNRFVNEGGSVVLFPSAKASVESWNLFLSTLGADLLSASDTSKIKIKSLNQFHPLYKDVFEKIPENIDLPQISKRYLIKSERLSRKETLLTLQNGDAYLNEYKIGKGRAYLFASPLSPNYSNLVRHAIFVTTLYRIAETAGIIMPIAFQIGASNSMEMKEDNFTEGKTFVRHTKTDLAFLPAIKKEPGIVSIQITDEIKEAGHYVIQNENEILTPLGFNYSRSESDPESYNTESLQTILSENNLMANFQITDIRKVHSSEALAGILFNKEFWWHCILLVVVFLLAESILLRLLK
ncbi:MAG: BatA domain-containing protein [Flavobacteriales bacterium]